MLEGDSLRDMFIRRFDLVENRSMKVADMDSLG